MKRIVVRCTALVLALFITMSMSAFAANGRYSGTATEDNANKLNQLGLFLGTGAGYDLEGKATRLHGVVMLIRLMGEDDDATSCTDTCPFTDVKGYGIPYMAYAYKKGYANGVNKEQTLFEPDIQIDFNSYVTLLLRALGYDDSQGDFAWNKSLDKAVEIGMMDYASAKRLTNLDPELCRGDLVDLSLCALTMNMKDKTSTLAEELAQRGVFTYEQGVEQGVLDNGKLCYTYKVIDNSTVTRTTSTYTVPSGKVTADVITVNTLNPKVSVKACLVDNTIGATDSFSNIVTESDAKVIVNSNFFEAYKEFKVPIGMVMSDGEFLYGEAGMNLFAFDAEGNVQAGNPSIVFEMASGKQTWTCFQFNMNMPAKAYGIIYTTAYGSSVNIVAEGVATIIQNGIIQDTYTVYAGDVMNIPEDGYLVYFGPAFTTTDYYRSPIKGEPVTIRPKFFRSISDGIVLDGIEQIVSGGPYLVDNGEICTVMGAHFNEARFTTATTPRTAIGMLADGKMILVSTSAATIQQMRELMLQLGCIEAMNLDGGGSTALAYDGKIIRSPGRQLTTTLHVFVDE